MKKILKKYGKLLKHILIFILYYSLFYFIPFFGDKFHFDYELILAVLKSLSFFFTINIFYLIFSDVGEIVWDYLSGND